MHGSVGERWEGNGGGGVVQDSMSLSDCLTRKLHPSYLNENRGVDNVIKTEKGGGINTMNTKDCMNR